MTKYWVINGKKNWITADEDVAPLTFSSLEQAKDHALDRAKENPGTKYYVVSAIHTALAAVAEPVWVKDE